MSKDIKTNVEQIWNKRVEDRIKERYKSQRAFIQEYRNRFKTGSQSDVSKWIHVDLKGGATGKTRKFPEFETMKKIAEVLEVSVGYLIGETDDESFDIEKTSDFIGLSSEGVIAIKNITSGKAIPPFHKYADPQVTAALEVLLTSPYMVDYLKKTCDLAVSINSENNPKEHFNEEVNRIPDYMRDDVVALWADAEDAIENQGVEGTKEQWDYVKKLDEAAMADMAQPELAEREINASRYAVNEIHIKMVDEIMSSDRMGLMLPHYASDEEIKQIMSGDM